MNKKIFSVFVSLMVVAMLALPMSAVSAKKPEKFETVTFYGYPGAVFGGDSTFERYGVGEGKSSNRFIIFSDPTDWCYCEDYVPEVSLPHFTPVDDFATGSYTGTWIIHGPSHNNVHEIFDMEITNWLGTGKTGNLVVLRGGNMLTIIGGTIDGQTVHGHGTSTEVIFLTLYEYTFTIHFEP